MYDHQVGRACLGSLARGIEEAYDATAAYFSYKFLKSGGLR
jgi:hypothetical protein